MAPTSLHRTRRGSLPPPLSTARGIRRAARSLATRLAFAAGGCRRAAHRARPAGASAPACAALIALLASLVPILVPSRPAAAHDSLDRQIAEISRQVDTRSAGAAGFMRRGDLYRLDHNWKAAAADYDSAARLDPNLLEVDVCRAALAFDQGKPRAAKPALDRFLARVPDHPEALKLRARVSLALGRPRDAVGDFDRMLEIVEQPTPDDYMARAQAVVACGPGSLEEAVRGLDRGIDRLGPLVSLESRAIDLELERRSFDSALARLDRIAPQFGRRDAVLERRGRILAVAGRAEEARAAYASALAEIDSMPPERRASPAVAGREARLKSYLAAGAPVPAAIGNTPHHHP